MMYIGCSHYFPSGYISGVPLIFIIESEIHAYLQAFQGKTGSIYIQQLVSLHRTLSGKAYLINHSSPFYLYKIIHYFFFQSLVSSYGI